jgi:hypothetical protein
MRQKTIDGTTLDYPDSAFGSDTSDFYSGNNTPDLAAIDGWLNDLLIEPPTPDTFDEAVQMGLEEAKHRSTRTWRLGWLALNVPTEYGKKTLAIWANLIGISASTANKARWLAKGFPSRIVRKYPELSVEHFTVVRGLLPKEVDPNDPKYAATYAEVETFLTDASICGWSVSQLMKEVHPDRDTDSHGFSLAGELGAEMILDDDGNQAGGVIGVYIEGAENYRQWVEQINGKGFMGLFMNAYFKEDEKE